MRKGRVEDPERLGSVYENIGYTVTLLLVFKFLKLYREIDRSRERATNQQTNQKGLLIKKRKNELQIPPLPKENTNYSTISTLHGGFFFIWRCILVLVNGICKSRGLVPFGFLKLKSPSSKLIQLEYFVWTVFTKSKFQV